jgi:hypothetical protein
MDLSPRAKMLSVPWSTPEASRLREGVLDPDRYRSEYSRHHWRKSEEIEINLEYARRCFLWERARFLLQNINASSVVSSARELVEE